MRFDAFGQAWDTVEDDPGLQARDLPPGLAFELVLEGRPVMLRQEPRAEARLPQLFAWGSGDMTPYALSLRRSGGSSITLVGSADGSIEIARDDEP
jgi:hypothetical protein